MISIVITTKKEEKTLPRAIKVILEEVNSIRNFGKLVISREYEVLIVGPDQETEKIAKEFSKKYPEIRYLKDKNRGKPAALNLAFKEARGEILVLTDGDVYIEKGVVAKILRHFENQKIGAVSGCPVSINSRKNIFGYWSYFLTEAADFVRKKKNRRGEYLVCSGYLYAFRNIIKKIPEDTLVEDEIISQTIWRNGYKIVYEPEAKVFVKYPDNFSDWLKQKIRATGGYIQKSQIPNSKFQTNSKFQILNSKQQMRGFLEEVSEGIKLFFTYPKNLKEFWWTILLYFARLYLWLLIFWQIKILKKTPWERVESTK